MCMCVRCACFVENENKQNQLVGTKNANNTASELNKCFGLVVFVFVIATIEGMQGDFRAFVAKEMRSRKTPEGFGLHVVFACVCVCVGWFAKLDVVQLLQ